jgi:hypothetical protein
LDLFDDDDLNSNYTSRENVTDSAETDDVDDDDRGHTFSSLVTQTVGGGGEGGEDNDEEQEEEEAVDSEIKSALLAQTQRMNVAIGASLLGVHSAAKTLGNFMNEDLLGNFLQHLKRNQVDSDESVDLDLQEVKNAALQGNGVSKSDNAAKKIFVESFYQVLKEENAEFDDDDDDDDVVKGKNDVIISAAGGDSGGDDDSAEKSGVVMSDVMPSTDDMWAEFYKILAEVAALEASGKSGNDDDDDDAKPSAAHAQDNDDKNEDVDEALVDDENEDEEEMFTGVGVDEHYVAKIGAGDDIYELFSELRANSTDDNDSSDEDDDDEIKLGTALPRINDEEAKELLEDFLSNFIEAQPEAAAESIISGGAGNSVAAAAVVDDKGDDVGDDRPVMVNGGSIINNNNALTSGVVSPIINSGISRTVNTVLNSAKTFTTVRTTDVGNMINVQNLWVDFSG